MHRNSNWGELSEEQRAYIAALSPAERASMVEALRTTVLLYPNPAPEHLAVWLGVIDYLESTETTDA